MNTKTTKAPLYDRPAHWTSDNLQYLGHDGIRDYYLVGDTSVFIVQGKGLDVYTHYLGELDRLHSRPWEC